MSTPRTFISFDFDNNSNHKLLFSGQAKNSRTPFNIADWSSKEALPQSIWERKIAEKISRCNLMIVLVGRQTAYAKGVIKEIRFAAAHNIPVFGVYVDGANTRTPLPTGLPRNMVISWNWESITSAINIVMRPTMRSRSY
ncbi:MAG: hypothetical protein COW01_15600 [Bdellovibrionales bacterium CG12_big_fil_rev_8_21_14_0_65_38_15]|nr:MAG: hypothetical protein COW79_14765 [Bdellovibrionales bacterium CG22_combo_CG10-13_8_21_14_all_38_13]PIQ52396.1 MAG: hypothetical protein COW01_15600 [Bdellovibrionales bacterium CG12_big_fil_rev_8_21_14_0_65_38_15]PIR29435.1 MAG: hypothetical protein COV38_10140 [Bdellovibrionales bacterium CG11_big_fil_rev_8_21_14_0_20_38_13]